MVFSCVNLYSQGTLKTVSRNEQGGTSVRIRKWHFDNFITSELGLLQSVH